MAGNPIHRRFIIGATCLLVAAGCTNPKDALQLHVATSKKAYSQDEAIYLLATLSATEGRNCVYKDWPTHLNLRLTHLDTEKDVERRRIFVCGNAYLLVAPFQPLIITGKFLDVANLGDRFSVLDAGDQQERKFAIQMTERGFQVVHLNHQKEPLHMIDALPPGRYRISATLSNARRSHDPPPLFWNIYGQAVSDSKEFEVLPSDEITITGISTL